MKLSKIPTDHILVRASTNSDRESCNFAIIDVAEAVKNTVLLAQDAIKILTKGDSYDNDEALYDFDEVKFYCNRVEFFNIPDEIIGKIVGKKIDSFSYSYINTTYSEINNKLSDYLLSVNCLRLSVGEVLFDFDGSGANNYADDYWTDGIPVDYIKSTPSPKKIKKIIEKSLERIKSL